MPSMSPLTVALLYILNHNGASRNAQQRGNLSRAHQNQSLLSWSPKQLKYELFASGRSALVAAS